MVPDGRRTHRAPVDRPAPAHARPGAGGDPHTRVLVPASRTPQGLRRERQSGHGRGQGRLRRRPRHPRRPRPAGHRRLGGRRGLAVRHRAGRHLPARGHRRAAARHADRSARLARRGRGDTRGGLSGDPQADRRPDARIRARRDAHQRPGLHDGVPGGRPARTGPWTGSGGVRVRGADPHPGHRGVDQAPGQARPDHADQAVHPGPARHRARHRLQHLPHVERLSGPVRLPGHRQRGPGEAPPARGAAARADRARRARGARRGGLRPEPGGTGRRAPRRGHRQGPGRPPRDPDHRLHGLDGVRRLAGDPRPPGAGLHREGRRQHGDRGVDRRLQGHAVQPRLLPVPVQRPDVHDPAEPPHPAGRHPYGRGPQVVRRGGGRPRQVGRRTPRGRRPGQWTARRHREPGREGPPRGRHAASARSPSPPGRSATPSSPTPSSARR